MSVIDTTTNNTIPGYQAGTWVIDPTHSEVSFSVRHLMVSKVRGRFARFSGELVTGDDSVDSSVEADRRPRVDRHQLRGPRRAPALAGLPRRRALPVAHLPVDRGPRRRRRLRRRRRADAPRRHPVRPARARGARLPAGVALRRQPRRVLGPSRDQPEGVRHLVRRAARERRSRRGRQDPDRPRGRGDPQGRLTT